MNYPIQYCIAGANRGDDGGAFKVPYKDIELFVIASHGGGWEHVSVSLTNRCPHWEEMCFIKDLFFNPEDCVIQYHPPKSKYVNIYENVLHLWRPLNVSIPMPPRNFI